MALTTGFDPGFFPGTSTLNPGAAAGSPSAKSQPLKDLYPEIDRYRIVSADRYTSPEFMEREWRGIWTKCWTCAGRVSDLPVAGSWLKFDLGRESFIVTRAADGTIRAFHNACQHRGRQLVTEDMGRTPSFVCRFHSWVYGLDGKNRRVTDREYFHADALCGDIDLKPVRCETWGGFVFVNMAPEAEPLLDFLDAMPAMLEAYGIEDMHLVKDVMIAMDCNWKVAAEAFLEPYHVHITHPALLPAVDDIRNQYDFYRNGHARLITPLGIPSPRERDRETVNPGLAYMLREAGIDPDRFEGSAADVAAAIAKAKRRDDNVFGLDYSAFTDRQLTDDWNPSIFPNLALNAFPEAVQVMRFLPHPTDPAKSFFHVWILVPTTKPGVRPPANFGVEDDVDVTGKVRPRRAYTQHDTAGVGDVLQQDIDNMAAVQRGLASAGMVDGLRLSEQEQRIQQFHAEIDRRLDRAGV
jgi:phenylpropionate dioxygenase-like ring-hydroxylating dioxygenase large terminal subunit